MGRALRWRLGLLLAGAIALACVVAFMLYGQPEPPVRPSSVDTRASEAPQRAAPNSLPVAPSTRDADVALDDFQREATKITLTDRPVDEALFRLKYREPAKFVKLEWREGVPYKYFRSMFTEKDAPEFLRLLSDERFADRWSQIAKMIGYLGAAEGTAAIVDYIRRKEDLSALSENGARVLALCKVSSIDGLGIIGTEESVKILRNAVTADGAAALTAAWINQIPDSKAREEILGYLQGAAARGLLRTQSEQNVSLVRDLYDRQKANCQRAGRRNEFMAQLEDAMAEQDFIEQHGREAFLNLLGYSQYMTEMLNRVGKYMAFPPKEPWGRE